MRDLMVHDTGVGIPGSADEKLGPDLPRGRGKSIAGDFNVDDEGSGHNFEPLVINLCDMN
jgi:hypothetical protein